MFRYRLFVPATGLLLSMAAAPAGQTPAAPVQISTAPPALAPSIARADAVFGTLQRALHDELMSAVRKGGFAGAIETCHLATARVAHDVGRAEGIAVGRTSDRLRNPTNAPKEWMAPVVARYAGAHAADAPGFVVDLGNRVGVLRPITVDPVCVGCHGAAKGLSAGVKAVLQERYPADKAVGFKAGDLRGWMWAEVPK